MHRRNVLKELAVLGLASMLVLVPGLAIAQSFPSKPVRVVTPFPAGSGPDAALRVVAEQLARKWGQPVVIDNRPGGNGFIAITAFKNAPADQHVFLMIDSNHATTHPSTFAKLPYNVQNDFLPIGMILRTPFFVAVAADSPYRTLEDIVVAARAKPDSITYGSWFMGSPGHIGALRLQAISNTTMRHVPFKDFGQLYAAVASKEVDWALGSVASAGGLERGGKLRFIAVAASKRDPLYPNVPASSEMPGLDRFDVTAWSGIFAPKSTPHALSEKFSNDILQALAQPSVQERYRTMGYEAPPLTTSDFANLIQRETKTWGQVIRAANLKLD